VAWIGASAHDLHYSLASELWSKILVDAINLTINEFCAAFKIGRTKAYELIAAGEVEAIKLGNKTLIPYAELEKLQARLPRMRPSTEAPLQPKNTAASPDL
jgi:excisionase family DNA binding protein